MSLWRSLAWMLFAALGEVFGCYAIWLWVRGERSAWILPLGLLSLAVFGWALAQVPMTYAGRTFAAYGGVYVAVALGWLMIVERVQPTRSDVLGVGLVLAGTVVLILGRR